MILLQRRGDTLTACLKLVEMTVQGAAAKQARVQEPVVVVIVEMCGV